jgi:hypothetical protein
MDPVQFLSCVQHINYHLLVNMKYSVIQRVFIVETYIRIKSHKKCHCKFWNWISGVSVLSNSTFYQLWTNFRQQFPTLKKKEREREWTQCVLSKERSEDIWRAFRGISKKYIKIIQTYSHTIVSFETQTNLQLCENSGMQTVLWEYGCLYGSINKPAWIG